MTLQIFLHFFHHKFVTSHSSTSLPPATSALSLRRIGDALLTSRLCLSLPHIATPAHSASEMRYSLETPFVRSAAEDAWGHSRPTPSALRRCATPPPARPRSADLIASRSSGGARPRERSRLQLTPDSVGGTRIDADAPRSAAANALLPYIYSGTALRCISPSPLSTLSPDALSGVN